MPDDPDPTHVLAEPDDPDPTQVLAELAEPDRTTTRRAHHDHHDHGGTSDHGRNRLQNHRLGQGDGPAPTDDLGRGRRAELLAAAEPDELLAVADRCLAEAPTPELLLPPEVGTVVLTVREPVEATRFQLGDVLVTRTQLVHRGAEGWAVRPGSDPATAVAAAVCDAEVEAGGPAGHLVEELCRATEARLARHRAREWAELAPTIVRFEEMA